MSSAISFNLPASVSSIITDAAQSITSGSYDPTKTTLVNRVTQRTLPGTSLPTMGPPPADFMDMQNAPLGAAPNATGVMWATDAVSPSTTMRVFVPVAPAAAVIGVLMFTYNYVSGAIAYLGRINLTLPTTTVHTIRGLAVDDNSGGTTGWKIFIETTNATAANGGLFVAYNIAQADFSTAAATVIPSATTGNTVATKAVFWYQETGGTNNLTAGIGLGLDLANGFIYAGQSTTNTIFYKFNYNVGSITPSATGVVTEPYLFKTGSYTGVGTSLQNSMKICSPKSSQNAGLIGQTCIYISSATQGYHLLASELTSGSSGALTPTAASWNKIGTGVDYISPVWVASTFSSNLDMEINFSSASGVFMMKRTINNDPNIRFFGRGDVTYTEAAGTITPPLFAGTTVVNMAVMGGVLFVPNTTVGQRGVYVLNMATDQYFLNTYTGSTAPSYILSPVISTNIAQSLALAFIREFNQVGVSPVVQYRTTNFAAFPGSWTNLSVNNNNLINEAGLANITQVQLRLSFNSVSYSASQSSQMNNIILAYTSLFESLENFAFDLDSTTQGTNTPSYVAFQTVKNWVTAPSDLIIRGYTPGSTSVLSPFPIQFSTSASLFSYSTDGGTTWNALPSIAALNTLGYKFRVNVTSPPGGNAVMTVRGS